MPNPIVMPPRHWLDAVFGLMILPQSKTPKKRETRTSPVSWSTRTSQNCAPYEPIEYFIESLPGPASASASIMSISKRARIDLKVSPTVESFLR